jgi:hypothetical protein
MRSVKPKANKRHPKSIKIPFLNAKNETPIIIEPIITIRTFIGSVLIKFIACKDKPTKSKEGPTITKGYKIEGVLDNWILNSSLFTSLLPKLQRIKSITHKPICATTPIVVIIDAIKFKVFLGKTKLKEINKTAPIKLNQWAKSIGF